MKKFILLLMLLLLIPLTASAAENHDPEGYMGYPWKTDLEVVTKEKVLQLVTENDSEKIYFSETDSSSNIYHFYIFSEDKLTSGVLQFKQKSDYIEGTQVLINQFGKPQREDQEKGYQGWFLGSTVIIATAHTEMPSISFFFQSDNSNPTP